MRPGLYCRGEGAGKDEGEGLVRVRARASGGEELDLYSAPKAVSLEEARGLHNAAIEANNPDFHGGAITMNDNVMPLIMRVWCENYFLVCVH